MDIIQFALQMELDGRAFYQKAADQATSDEIRQIFRYLADEEHRHYNVFRMLAEGRVDTADKALADSGSLENTKNVFVQLIEANKGQQFGSEVRSTWQEALKIEEKAVELYSEEAEKESETGRKALLKRIADEERNHVYLIDNMLSFMSDPQGFADSQQFAAFKSWEGH